MCIQCDCIGNCVSFLLVLDVMCFLKVFKCILFLLRQPKQIILLGLKHLYMINLFNVNKEHLSNKLH